MQHNNMEIQPTLIQIKALEMQNILKEKKYDCTMEDATIINNMCISRTGRELIKNWNCITEQYEKTQTISQVFNEYSVRLLLILNYELNNILKL